MARLSDEMQKVARDKMSRAAKRLNGAATAVARKDVTEGEEATVIRSVVATLTADKVASVPAPVRLSTSTVVVTRLSTATGRRSSTGMPWRMRLWPAASFTVPPRSTSNVAG